VFPPAPSFPLKVRVVVPAAPATGVTVAVQVGVPALQEPDQVTAEFRTTAVFEEVIERRVGEQARVLSTSVKVILIARAVSTGVVWLEMAAITGASFTELIVRAAFRDVD